MLPINLPEASVTYTFIVHLIYRALEPIKILILLQVKMVAHVIVLGKLPFPRILGQLTHAFTWYLFRPPRVVGA